MDNPPQHHMHHLVTTILEACLIALDECPEIQSWP
jgi:hypothetical protein